MTSVDLVHTDRCDHLLLLADAAGVGSALRQPGSPDADL